jgi:predicted nucleic acid-binding protein
VRRLQAGGVIDASVAVKPVMLDEDDAHIALAIVTLAGHAPNRLWAMPDVFDVECANVIRKSVVRGRLRDTQAGRALRLVLEMPGQRVATGLLVETGLALAAALAAKVSVYDACYLALADLLGVPLVTADRRLVEAAVPSGHDVIFLGDVLI